MAVGGGTGVEVGNGVAVGGTGVAVGTGVLVGWGVLVGGATVAVKVEVVVAVWLGRSVSVGPTTVTVDVSVGPMISSLLAGVELALARVAFTSVAAGAALEPGWFEKRLAAPQQIKLMAHRPTTLAIAITVLLLVFTIASPFTQALRLYVSTFTNSLASFNNCSR